MVRQTTTPKKDLEDGTNTLSDEDRRKLQERSQKPDDERQAPERHDRDRDRNK